MRTPGTEFPDRTERRAGPGTRLNGIYEIDGIVATGGMGVVYSGRAIETGARVAIKMIRREFAENERVISLFRKEAAAIHRLQHEALVRYYVFTTDPDLRCPYLAMEFVEGPSLLEVGRLGPLDPAAARVLLRRLASGLHAAHEAGVIHRDVSPDNIILPDADPARAKIIDFGIARSARDGATVIGSDFAGKANYASPEQVGLFGGEVTPRSDIYGLGLTLAAALRGRPLAMGGTHVEVVTKRQGVPDLAGVDEALRPLLTAMLQPRPEDRPAGMAEVALLAERIEARTGASAGREETILAAGPAFAKTTAPTPAGGSDPSDAAPSAAPSAAGAPEAGPAADPVAGPATAPPPGPAPGAPGARGRRRLVAARAAGIAAGIAAVAAVSGAYLAGVIPGAVPPVRFALRPPADPSPTAGTPEGAVLAEAPAGPTSNPPAAGQPIPSPPAAGDARTAAGAEAPPASPAPDAAPPQGNPAASTAALPAAPPGAGAPSANAPAAGVPAAGVASAGGTAGSESARGRAGAPVADESKGPAPAGAFRDCARCPEMLSVPAGSFAMGANGDPTERPVHKVALKAFAVGRHPVTVREWKACVADGQCVAGPDGDDDAPAHNLSWDDARAYALWLAAVTGAAYRLPSEAEWEYAARAGATTRYWWGDQFRADLADCRRCGAPAAGAPSAGPPPASPSRIGRLPANRFGLGEVTGSVSQWMADCWVPNYRGAPPDGSARQTRECGERVLRGGSWMMDPDGLRVSSREFYDAGVRYPGHGLRVARSL